MNLEVTCTQYNKLRKYRSQVKALEDELRQHKEQASSARNKYAEWNAELQKKLKELREEKKTWMSESATLRGAEKKAMVLMCGPGSSDKILTNFRLCLLRKQNFLQEQLTTSSNCRLDRRRISTKSTDYETMSVRLNNTLKSKSFGLLSSRTLERFSNFMLTQG